MKKNLIVSCTLMLFLFFSSCEKSGKKDLTRISYGTSFGMCVDYCVRNMVIVEQQVTYTKSKNGSNPDPKTCTNTISKEELDEIKSLSEASKINSLPGVIGCPDCADGGAEWIEMTTNGKKYKVTFEYNNTPNELKAIAIKLRALATSFKDCN